MGNIPCYYPWVFVTRKGVLLNIRHICLLDCGRRTKLIYTGVYQIYYPRLLHLYSNLIFVLFTEVFVHAYELLKRTSENRWTANGPKSIIQETSMLVKGTFIGTMFVFCQKFLHLIYFQYE